MMFDTLARIGDCKKNVLSLRLKTEVSVIVFSSIGREFHTRGLQPRKMHDRQVYDAMTAEQDHDDWRNEVLHVEELKQTV